MLTTIKKRVLLVNMICICAIACTIFAAGTLGRAGHGAPEQSTKTQNEPTPDARMVELLTPTEGVEFGPYLNNLLPTVKRNWYAKMPDEASKGIKGRVVVRFGIRRDGALLDKVPMVEASSGTKALDNAAVDAIRASAPFEHLPESFKGPNIDLRFNFYYNTPLPRQHP